MIGISFQLGLKKHLLWLNGNGHLEKSHKRFERCSDDRRKRKGYIFAKVNIFLTFPEIEPGIRGVLSHNRRKEKGGTPRMKRSRFSEYQVVGALKEFEGGHAVKDICREYGISKTIYYN
jgi:hypothetical protein